MILINLMMAIYSKKELLIGISPCTTSSFFWLVNCTGWDCWTVGPLDCWQRYFTRTSQGRSWNLELFPMFLFSWALFVFFYAVATQIFFIYTPTWGNDPIWQSYLSNELVQPPSSFLLALFLVGALFWKSSWSTVDGRKSCTTWDA